MRLATRVVLVLGIFFFSVLGYLWQDTGIAGAEQAIIDTSSVADPIYLPFISGEAAGPSATPTLPAASATPGATTVPAVTPSATATSLPSATAENTPTPTSTSTSLPTATATRTPTPTNTPKPTNTPTNTPKPTATSAPGNTGDVRITKIFFDGAVFQTESDEFVEIKNFDTKPIRLQNWKLHDEGVKHTYTFPNYTIQPGQSCRVYTNENHPDWCGFNWGNNRAIWNNDGDVATLKDSSGKTISTCSYSGSGTTKVCP
ncbi:MAG: lamin tail domain-containing protein [Chloroflexota bacterium]